MVDNSCPNPPEPFSEVTKPTTKRTGLLCDGASPRDSSPHPCSSCCILVAASSLPVGWGIAANCCKIMIFDVNFEIFETHFPVPGGSVKQRLELSPDMGRPIVSFIPAWTWSSFFRRWRGWGQTLLLLHPQLVAEITCHQSGHCNMDEVQVRPSSFNEIFVRL